MSSAKGKERFKIFGVLIDSDSATEGGDTLWSNGKQVGVITCGMYSRLTRKSMAIARLEPRYAEQGQRFEVRGKAGIMQATAHTLPFDDPQKLKRTAKG